MKRFIILAILCFVYVSLQAQSSTSDTQAFGKIFVADHPIPFTDVPQKVVNKDSVELQTTGIVKEVCQAKGCWMKVDAGEGQEMMVRFKNYGFFVPKDIVGKKVILNGVAYQHTLSVAQLRHYAEDAGKSEKEIAQIKKPQTSLHFQADGVILTEK